MKRILMVLGLILLCVCCLYAGDRKYLYDEAVDGLTLSGYVGDSWYLSVNTAAIEGNRKVTDDFDLGGSDVAYIGDESPYGRVIATWSIVANIGNSDASQWHLKIHADPLTTPGGSYAVAYHLTFSMHNENDSSYAMIVHSNPDGTYFYNETLDTNITSLDKPIRFMLDRNEGHPVETWEQGIYTANVIIELEKY